MVFFSWNLIFTTFTSSATFQYQGRRHHQTSSSIVWRAHCYSGGRVVKPRSSSPSSGPPVILGILKRKTFSSWYFGSPIILGIHKRKAFSSEFLWHPVILAMHSQKVYRPWFCFGLISSWLCILKNKPRNHIFYGLVSSWLPSRKHHQHMGFGSESLPALPLMSKNDSI